MTSHGNIFILNIFHMLAYAFKELNLGQYKSISCESFDNIQDLFAEIIYRGISSQLKQGLHRSYVQTNEDIPTLRGRLNITESLKLKCSGRALLNCEYDNFSADNLYNQILARTIRVLIHHNRVNHTRKTALKSILPYFAELTSINLDTIRWNTLVFDRNSRRYQLLIYLCYMLSKQQLINTNEGAVKGTELIDNQKLHRLFEKFILEFYRTHYPELKPAASQIDWNLDSENSPGASVLPVLQTDIILKTSERTLILDAKFYNTPMQTYFGKQTIHSHNQNQIFTYVMNLDKSHKGNVDGMLIYAKTNDDILPNDHITLADGNRIFYRSLDLNQDFSKIVQQLDDIAKIIKPI